MISRGLLSLTLLATLAMAQSKPHHPVKAASEPAPTPQEAVFNTDKIVGKFQFLPSAKGGVEVTFTFESGLSIEAALAPSKGYEYHIHVNPVGPNNDCAATGGHLDPANVGPAKCNTTMPDKCQEGDLSGKHGEIKGTATGAIEKVSYLDKSLAYGTGPQSIEHRSVVIHNNGTRIACANILPEGTSPAAPSPADGGASNDSHRVFAADGSIKPMDQPSSSSASNLISMSVAAMGVVAAAMVIGF